jgi:hypothetical protein
MNDIQTKIGDHFIKIITDSEDVSLFLDKNYSSFKSNFKEKPNLIINIKNGYGVSFKDYVVEITKENNKIFYRRADYLIEVTTNYDSANIYVYDELALKHALMNLYSSFIVHYNWGLLIHSSCAINKGKAHVFAGKSGAGKSTAAKLSYPRELLSDEATLVKITPAGIKVFNSPFRSEIHTASFEGEVDLASIQILHQSLQNKRDQIKMSDALIQLMDKVFFWAQSQEETKTILKLITTLVKQVPVFDLHFQKNNTFWELIS